MVCICGLPTDIRHTHHLDAPAASYPNPLRSEEGVLNIDLRGTQVSSLQILDLSGRTLRSDRVKQSPMRLDLHGLLTGTYLLKHLAGNTCLRTERIVIQ